jgi:hypothetical protein
MSALPETVECKEHPGKMLKLRDGKWGPYYSHVIDYDKGEYCNKKVKDLGLESEDAGWIDKAGTEPKDLKAEDTEVTWKIEQQAKDKKISRMNAQSQALKWADIYVKIYGENKLLLLQMDLEKIKEWTDHFAKDAEQAE